MAARPSIHFVKTGKLDDGEVYDPKLHNGSTPSSRGRFYYTPEEIKYFEDEENIESNKDPNTYQDNLDDTDLFKEAKIKTLLKIANILDKKQKYILADVITMKMKNPL